MKELIHLSLTNWPAAIVVIFSVLFISAAVSSVAKKFFTYLNVRRHGWPAPGITIAGEDDPIITFKTPEGAHFTAMAGKEVKIKDHFYPERNGDYELRPKPPVSESMEECSWRQKLEKHAESKVGNPPPNETKT